MLNTFIALLVGALIILAIIAITGILNLLRSKSGPQVVAVINALQKYLYLAIYTGDNLSLTALDELKNTLAGQDKKVIADSLYDLLPDHLTVGGVPVPIVLVKLIVPRDKFETLVEDVYQEAQVFISQNEAYLKAQVDAWVKQHAPTTTPTPDAS